MATVDPSIALGVKPLQLDNPMNAMAMYSQIQGAQQANQLNRLKMDEYERARAEEEGVRNALARGDINLSTPEGRAGLLKYGKTGLEYGKALTEQQKAATERQAAEVKLVDDKLKQSRNFLEGVQTPEQYLAWHEANHRDPVLGPILASRGITAEQSRARIASELAKPGGLEKLINESKLGVEKFAERNTMTAYEKAQVGLRGQEVDLRRREVDRASDPEMQQKLARARAIGEAAGKGDVAALQAYPKAIAQAEMTVNIIDQMIGKRDSKGNLLKGEKVHPGFEGAVGAGIGARYVPGTEASNFEALFNQAGGNAFMQAFEALKGGGAITEKEGAKATSAITRMSLAQSEKEFIKAATEFQDVVRAGAARAQERASRGSAAPAVPGVPTTPTTPATGGVKFLGFE